MSTATAPAPIKPPVQPSAPPLPPSAAPPPAIPPFPVRPLTVEQFEYLVDLGFYGDEKIELLDGWVVNKMTHGDLASFIIMRLSRQLGRTLSEAVTIRCQLPIRLPRSRPEPDIVVAQGGEERYRTAAPTPDDLLLLVEVSDSILDNDCGPKGRSYARAGITPYWVVNCVDRQVEVYTQPTVIHGEPKYEAVARFALGEAVPLRLPNEPAIDISASALFGEA
jgi:hypothetical protein